MVIAILFEPFLQTVDLFHSLENFSHLGVINFAAQDAQFSHLPAQLVLVLGLHKVFYFFGKDRLLVPYP